MSLAALETSSLLLQEIATPSKLIDYSGTRFRMGQAPYISKGNFRP